MTRASTSRRREFVFLVGPSGSGKSTLLRLMNRQEKPEKGEVWVAGRNINDMPDAKVPHLRRNIGNIFQDYKLLSNKTVFENVAFALEVIGRPKHVIRQQVPAVLDLVGLAGKQERFPHQLSGGEQQRVSIARAFVNRPLILLADEPTGNLDPATGEGIMRLLDRINKTGHDRRHGDARPAHREHDAQAGHPARPRHHRARPDPWCVRVDVLPDLEYTFREMWASLRRNLTLTVAAIITASVSLLLFGLTLLIQRGFDNQLSQWSGGVELIVYLRNDASELQIREVREALESQPNIVDTSRLEYLDLDASLAEAQRLFAGDPDTLQLLTRENMPTQFKVVPTDEASTELAHAAERRLPRAAGGAVGRLPRQGDRRADDPARVHRPPPVLHHCVPAARRRSC